MIEKNFLLTKDQESIVQQSSNELLIKGIAGSGKTIVLIKRAIKLAKEKPESKVIIFCYNKALQNSTKQLIDNYKILNIEVLTFHAWALKNFRSITSYSIEIVNRPDELLKKAIIKSRSHVDNRFVNNEDYLQFILDEIQWMKGRGVTKYEDYLNIERLGRGGKISLSKKDRGVIFTIFEEYEVLKSGRFDLDDLGLVLSKFITKIPEKFHYDHVLVDEAQDLQMNQLKVLRGLAKESFTVAADISQKIYKTYFTWKEIGINVAGNRSKVLKESHRSTREILKLASNLQKYDSLINDEEYTPINLPERSGLKPEIFSCSSEKDYSKVLNSIVKQLPHKEITVGILAKSWNEVRMIQNNLKSNLIKSEIIKKEKGSVYSPGVKITTFYTAKGLEFDVVIVANLTESTEEEISREIDTEEYWNLYRRLLYVSFTRAKTMLYVIAVKPEVRLLKELDENCYTKRVIS